MLQFLGLDHSSERVYRIILANPTWRVTDISVHLGETEESVRRSLDVLADLALLRRSFEDPDGVHVVSPETGFQSIIRKQMVDLARRQLDLAESEAAISLLINEYSREPDRGSNTDTQRLTGIDEIQSCLEELSEKVSREVMTFMTGGPQSPAAITAARKNNERALARGVVLRNVCLDSVHNDPLTVAHLLELVAAGGHVCTVAVLPPRMLIFDRTVAIASTNPQDSRQGALVLRSLGVVSALVSLFEHVWDSAEPLATTRDEHERGSGANRQQRALMHLLAEGLTDEAAAKRMGVSVRTARRMMAELMVMLGARSRFEAGARAAERGWLASIQPIHGAGIDHPSAAGEHSAAAR